MGIRGGRKGRLWIDGVKVVVVVVIFIVNEVRMDFLRGCTEGRRQLLHIRSRIMLRNVSNIVTEMGRDVVDGIWVKEVIGNRSSGRIDVRSRGRVFC